MKGVRDVASVVWRRRVVSATKRQVSEEHRVLVTTGDPPGMSTLKLFAIKPEATTLITELHFTEAVTAITALGKTLIVGQRFGSVRMYHLLKGTPLPIPAAGDHSAAVTSVRASKFLQVGSVLLLPGGGAVSVGVGRHPRLPCRPERRLRCLSLAARRVCADEGIVCVVVGRTPPPLASPWNLVSPYWIAYHTPAHCTHTHMHLLAFTGLALTRQTSWRRAFLILSCF